MTSSRSASLSFLFVLLAALVSAANTFVNPIAEGADPWVIRDGDQYYWCYSDGNRGVAVSRSSRLRSVGTGRVVWQAPETGPHSREIWAPELHRFGDRWYVYVAASNGRNENHRTIVLESATSDPLSDYHLKSELYTGDHFDTKEKNRWAIDLTPLELRGQLYGIWSGWEAEKDEQWLYVAPMSNPWTISGNRVKLCDNDDFLWERVDEKLTGRGLHEAPQVLRRGDRVFIVYSTSGSWQPSYKLGILELERGSDPLKPGAWKKHPEPVFVSTEKTFGVGHCCFIASPDGREDWLVFHAKMSRVPGWHRALFLQPFGWTPEGWPDFRQPVTAGEPLPWPGGERAARDARAPLEADFAKGLEGWDSFGHHQLFSLTREGVRIGASRGQPINLYRCGEKLIAADRSWADATIRTRVKLGAGGEAGVLLRVTEPALGREAQRGYFVGLNPEHNGVRLVRFDGGANIQLISVSHALRVGAWHDVEVQSRGPDFAVSIDGKVVLRARDDRWAEGSAGVRVGDGEAEFAGFAVR